LIQQFDLDLSDLEQGGSMAIREGRHSEAPFCRSSGAATASTLGDSNPHRWALHRLRIRHSAIQWLTAILLGGVAISTFGQPAGPSKRMSLVESGGQFDGSTYDRFAGTSFYAPRTTRDGFSFVDDLSGESAAPNEPIAKAGTETNLRRVTAIDIKPTAISAASETDRSQANVGGKPAVSTENIALTPTSQPSSRPAVTLWTFLANNRLSLELRFLGLKKALRRQLDMGPLTIKGLKRAKFKIVGTRKIDGETLPIVSVEYPRANSPLGNDPPVSATLGSTHATVKALSMRLAVRIYRFDKSRKKRVLAHVDSGDMKMLVEDIAGTEPTNFGPLNYAVKSGTVEIAQPVFVRQEPSKKHPPSRWSTGAFAVSGTDLKFDDLALTFDGENNALKLSGGVSMPNVFNWTYYLDRGLWSWNDGAIEVRHFQLLPVPQRPINFGGLTVGFNGIHVASAQVTRDVGGTPFPRVALSDITIDASTLAARNGLEGSLSAPLTIHRVDAQLNIKNNSIEEGLNLAHLRAQDVSIKLTAMKYSGASGLTVTADNFALALADYRKDDSDDPNIPPTSTISAHITLGGGKIKGPADVTIENLDADLRGPVDKFNGKGTATVRLSGFSTTVDIDPTKTVKNLSCNGGIRPLQIDASQQGSSTFTTEVFFFDGLPTARTTADQIAFSFNPRYWRCEWDSKVAAVKVPDVTWDTPKLKCCPPSIEWGGVHFGTHDENIQVHWIAELQPVPGAGIVFRPDVKIDKDGLKLCGGHALGSVPFWSPQIGPNFNDCGFFLCNIPRDAIRAAWGAVGAPFGLLAGSLGDLAVNTVGFFDAGLLGNRCQ
jgi:hypothetical protein